MYLTQLTHTALQHNVQSSKWNVKIFNSISAMTINTRDQLCTLNSILVGDGSEPRSSESNQLVSRRINIALYIMPMRIKNMTIGTFDVYETD